MNDSTSELEILPVVKSSDEIGHEMERTRESIAVKVEALESQVLGTIQTATDTVTDTVDAVKGAVTAAPGAVRDTLREIVDVAKETMQSFSASGCIRSNPSASLGASAFAGFLVGFLTGGRGGKSTAHTFAAQEPLRVSAASMPAPRTGLLSEAFERLGNEVRELAGLAMSRGIEAIKKSIETQVPEIVNGAVEHITGATHNGRVRASV